MKEKKNMLNLKPVIEHAEFTNLPAALQKSIRGFEVQEVGEIDEANLFATNTRPPFYSLRLLQDLKRFEGLDKGKVGNLVYGTKQNNADLTDCDLLRNHDDKLAGRKNKFYIIPLRLSKMRVYKSENGQSCKARDALTPEQPVFATSCSVCPKKNGPREDKCRYKATIHCIAGDMGRIASLTLTGTALGLFFDDILPVFNQCSPLYKKMIVLRTELVSREKFTWMGYKFEGIVDTPVVLKELAVIARPLVLDYYARFNKPAVNTEFTPEAYNPAMLEDDED